ncbi:MAG: C25 family peptidase propeptide domain-containing protein [candidate division KSB1 bacterium]|nr:C25 family peptidase propeptide domain-containing protein [candidate division KSB1 bacterium]
MKQLEIILSIIFLSWVCSLSAQSRFEITETGNEIILEWHCPNLSFQSIVLQNEIYSLPVLSGLAHQQTPGAPQLPVDATLIYAPDLKLESLDSVTALHSTGTVCPAPAYSQTDAGDVLTRYEPDPAIYSSSALYPQSFVRLDKATSSGKTVWRVQITPLQYDPVNNRLVQARYLRLRLAKSTQPSAREPEALFKSSTTKTVSRRFEQAAQTKPVKLKCAQPGVYAINGSDLQAIDVAIQSLNPSTLQLYHKDQEQSIQLQGMQDDRFDPDDRILFYAERLSGDTTFYHAYTDTNIYWLTWGITTGRHKTASVTSAPTSAPLSSFNHTLHIERDLDYYQGDDNHAIQNSFTTPGEGWVWENLSIPAPALKPPLIVRDISIFRIRSASACACAAKPAAAAQTIIIYRWTLTALPA